MKCNKISQIELSADEFFIYASSCDILKFSFIKKVPDGWKVLSEKGKPLSKIYKTKEEAIKRLKQIEYFKHLKKASVDIINLSDCSDFSYSSIIREFRKHNKNRLEEFQKVFKKYFDINIQKNITDVDKLSLIESLNDFANKYEIEIKSEFIKNASAIELGNPEYAGKYLSDIVKFVMQRIAPENRNNSMNSLKNKILSLDEVEISSKDVPASAAMGQSITFIKHVLMNHNPKYIREVLNNIADHLV